MLLTASEATTLIAGVLAIEIDISKIKNSSGGMIILQHSNATTLITQHVYYLVSYHGTAKEKRNKHVNATPKQNLVARTISSHAKARMMKRTYDIFLITALS